MSKTSKNKLFEQITDMSNKVWEKTVGSNSGAILIDPTKPFTKKILACGAKKKRKERNKAWRKMLLDSLEDARNWHCPECDEQCQPFNANWRFNTDMKVWEHYHGTPRVIIKGVRKV